MEVYIALLIFILCIIFLQEYMDNSYIIINRKRISLLGIIVFIIFLAIYSLRDNIGYDYVMYVGTVYGGFADDVYASKGEFLSATLLNIAAYLDNAYIFFFLVALLSLPLIIYAVENYSDTKESLGWGMLTFLALPIGFVNTLSIQRQFVAIAILLYATKFLISRNLIKYTLSILLASTFHISSLICIAFYFITSRKFKYKYFFLIAVVGVFITLLGIKIISILFPFYSAYISSFSGFDSGGKAQIIMYLFWGMLFGGLSKYLRRHANYDIFLKSYIGGLLMTILLIPFDANLAFRLGLLGLLNLIFLMPYIFKAFKNNSRFLVKLVCAILLSLIYIYGLLITDGDSYIPYKTFI